MIVITGRYLGSGSGTTQKGKKFQFHEMLVKNGWKNEVVTINDYKNALKMELGEDYQIEVMISVFKNKNGNAVKSLMAITDNGGGVQGNEDTPF